MRNAPRRAIVRWAWRLFCREWRQQALVLSLITVAVAAAIFGASAAYNLAPSADGEFGRADRRVELRTSDPATLVADLGALEARFETTEVIGHRPVPVPGSVERIDLRTQVPDGPLGAPMLALRQGRYPVTPDEVALTDEVAQSFGTTIGGTVELDGPKTVVGLVENPADLHDEFALAAPSSSVPQAAVTVLVSGADRGPAPAGGAQVSDDAFGFESRGNTEKTTAAALALVLATVVLLLICLVAAAGFAVVAQRRLRQLGMLAATGATGRHLRLVVLANGFVVGAVSAVAAAAIAFGGWTIAGPSLEAVAGHRIDRFSLPWWVIGAGMILAVVTATAAAWWPARSVARVPIVLALSSRPPPPQPVHRSALAAALFVVCGFAGLAAGVDTVHDKANPLLLMGGTVAIVLAILFASPLAIRALAATAARRPVAVRLALRDLARHQARSGAALAAISLGLGIAVATVVIATAAAPAGDEGNLSDRQVLIHTGDEGPIIPERTPAELERLQSAVDGFAATLATPVVVRLDGVVNPVDREVTKGQVVRPAVTLGQAVDEDTSTDAGVLYVATPALLDYLGIDPASIDRDATVLTATTGDLRLVNLSKASRAGGPSEPVGRVWPIAVPAYSSAPRSLMLPEELLRRGWQAAPSAWLVESGVPLTAADRERARTLAAESGMRIEARRDPSGLAATRSAATAAGLLVALSILGMTVGLIRSEAGPDLRTLTATGATSTTRRTITAATAGALALLGAVLGSAGAYVGLVAGYLDDLERLGHVPLLNLGITILGLPVLAAVIGWLAAGREPATLSRLALE